MTRSAVLSLVGDIDIATQGDYRAAADVLLLDERVTELIIDCSAATLLDSAGIGLLVHLSILTGENRVGLALRAVPPCVRSTLTLTQLDRVLRILDVR